MKKEHILLMCNIYSISNRSQHGHLDCGTEIWPCLKQSTKQKCANIENMIKTTPFQLGNIISHYNITTGKNFLIMIISQYRFLMV